ncbi:MAG: type IIL restriction-modification enzyme MmeI, partial [Ruminococcus sp.]
LKSYANIIEANALRIDWETVVPKEKLNYVMGNPPFVGHQNRTAEQMKDMEIAFYDLKKHGKLDYVCAWYNKACDYMQGTCIQTAFVSTNSIAQGESVALLWKFLFSKQAEIQFAHRSFPWASESNNQATVHCVIVGFSCLSAAKGKKLYENNRFQLVDHINGYLVSAPDVFIESRGKQLTEDIPEIVKGSQATDGGNLFVTEEERNTLITQYPHIADFIKRFVGAEEFINNKSRYCLWLKGVSPSEYRNIHFIRERLEKITELRSKSPTASVRKDASTPMLFTQIRQPETDYLIVPRHSSEGRKYIPLGYMSKDVICGDANMLIPNATLYLFGILTSNVHMAWMRTVCGRLEMRYRYTPAIYNNFPWCNPTAEQKKKIEETAQGILDARELYPDCSLADLYDELTMPPELRKAHQANDKAVMKAYGFKKDLSESAIVAELMKMYQTLIGE